ncbi:MAG: lipoyl(octanoyl) transferase LipB [Deferrisomatales bacterium]
MSRRTVTLVAPAGLVPYAEAWELQRRWVAQRRAGERPDTLLLLEHRPVITLGRNADPRGVLAPPERLAALGVEVHRVERGGQATYHGPGQVVGYPILHLRPLGMGVRRYVDTLEEVMIRTARVFGVDAYRVPGRPGAYCDRGKLGAVGVAVRAGVSFHGFAFNVCPDLSHFRLIVPCGLTDVAPTSLEALRAPGPTPAEAREVLAESFAEAFGVDLQPERPPAR